MARGRVGRCVTGRDEVPLAQGGGGARVLRGPYQAAYEWLVLRYGDLPPNAALM